MATMAATKQHLGNACWGDRQRQQKRKRPLALALALPLGSGQRKGGKPVSVSAYCVAQGSTLARRAGLSAETKKQLQRVPPRGSRRVSVRQDDARKRRRPRGVEAHGFAELAAYVSTQALNGPPYMYFLYLIAAGCGVPVSEDALVCWIGACLALKQFTLHKDVVVLALTYLGVVLSDMITFYIGVMMERGVLNRFFPNFAESESAKKAKQKVQQWGQKVGFMQRFCIGFRAPLCLMSGLVGVKPKNFFYGTSCGAVFSMSGQIFVGYLLRNTPNAYISTLALVAMPTLVGNVLGPMAMTLSAFLVKWRKRSAAPKKDKVNVVQQ